ncbi:MAG: hypothetical protein V8R01_02600 [Bacilli bacterium]
MMIDTHCHLGKEDYENRGEVIKNMGNNIMIVSTASPNDIDDIISLCNKSKYLWDSWYTSRVC